MGAIGRYGVDTVKLLTTDQVCAKVGLTPNIWHDYVSQGKAPQPATYASLGARDREPLWDVEMVESWQNHPPFRPGTLSLGVTSARTL
jgi:hypothetical protein